MSKPKFVYVTYFAQRRKSLQDGGVGPWSEATKQFRPASQFWFASRSPSSGPLGRTRWLAMTVFLP